MLIVFSHTPDFKCFSFELFRLLFLYGLFVLYSQIHGQPPTQKESPRREGNTAATLKEGPRGRTTPPHWENARARDGVLLRLRDGDRAGALLLHDGDTDGETETDSMPSMPNRN